MYCDECGGIIVKFRGEYVCSKCGLVIGHEMMSERPSFDGGFVSYGSRGAGSTSPSHHDRRLGTITPRKFSIVQRFATSARRKDVFIEIHRMCSALSLPSYVRDTAAILYRKYVSELKTKGPRKRTIIGAAVYAACRAHKIIKLPADFKQAGITNDAIKLAKKLLKKYGKEKTLTPPKPADYVPVICNRLGLYTVIDEACRIASANENIGKAPVSVAAAAVYLAARRQGFELTQKALAKASGVSEVTIRNVSKYMTQ